MDRFLKGWIKNSLIMQGDSVSSIKANKCFNELLSWVVKENYQGACHDVSIALHVLLSECGLKCNICIGEVKVSEYEYFDHSWVEADGFIYDIAVSGNIRFVYGMESPEGLDDVTQFVLQSDINQYLEGHPNGVGFIWHLIKKVAKSCNIKLNKAKLREMYGWTKRTFKTA
jgi:hypothetical protein